jgi:hypothetical protein
MAKSKADRVAEAEKALKDGKPMPSGVSYNAYRVPQFIAIEDDPEITDAEREAWKAASEAADKNLADEGIRIAQGASVVTPRTSTGGSVTAP